MSLRDGTVRILEGILMIDAEEFDPRAFRHEPVHREVPLEFAVLGEATYGPRGGFLDATLKDSRDGRVVWTFFRGHRELYEQVAATISARAA